MAHKTTSDFIQVLMQLAENEKVRQLISRGFTYMDGNLLDANNDGQIDQQDYEILLERSKYIVSVLSNAVVADKEIQDEEMDAVNEIIYDFIIGVEGLLNEDMLSRLKKSHDDLMDELNRTFRQPYSMEKIVEYARTQKLEKLFFEFACAIVAADNVYYQSEQEFLNYFAKQLHLSEADDTQIRKTYNLTKGNLNKEGGLFAGLKS
jgi:uncharacterized membrane protein YebE (DUF533 family)